MCRYIRLTLILLLQLGLTITQANASKMKRDIEGNIKKHGYDLSESGIRAALTDANREVVYDSMEYIEQKQLTGLLPEVKALFEHADRQEMFEGVKLRFLRCVISIDKNMPDNVRTGYLERIRKHLFSDEYKSVPIQAYIALIAAQEHLGVDIYDDLVHLSCTDIMGSGDFPFDTRTLFELYGDKVTEADLDKMLEAWSDAPKREEFILRRAREHGMRLEQTPESPERQESQETGPPAQQAQN